MRLRIFAAVASAALSITLVATAQKRPLVPTDFDSWKTINGQVLTHDGHYLAYGLFPQEGDGLVVLRDLKSGQEWKASAGQLPPPVPDDPGADAPAPPRTIKLEFSQDGHWLVYLAYASHDAVEVAKKDKKKPAQEELVLVETTTGKATRVPAVKSFQIPKEGNGYVAYLKYGPVKPDAKDDTKPAGDDSEEVLEAEEDQARGAAAASRGAGAGQEFGSEMVVRKLADGSEQSFADVLDYAVTKNGHELSYAVVSSKSETDGVFVIEPLAASNAAHELMRAKARYDHLAWDEKGNELAFIASLSNTDKASVDDGKPAEGAPAKAEKKAAPYDLYLWKTSEAKAAEIVTLQTPGFRKGYEISDHAVLTFSKDGERLFFGAAPPPPPPHATAIDEDKPSFDLWNYKDDTIPPAQKVRATADRNRSYRAVYLVAQKKMVQLADETMPELTPNESARYGLGSYDRDYRAMQDYSAERVADYSLVDMATGERTPIEKKLAGTLRWSGDGRYALTFDGKDWWAITLPGGRRVNLTAKLPVKFFNEEYDSPSTPPAYGFGGWTKDDKHVLLYDHWDIWQVAMDGTAINLTAGYGRQNHLELRYVKPDPEEKTIDPAKPLLLHAEDTETHQTGFFTTRIDAKAAPQKLLLANKEYNSPIKAKDADVYVVTEQDYQEFPDLRVTDGSFHELKKVSDANPQQAGLLWGSDEMVAFENVDGVHLKGILYKPENFDPTKKYPMIVYLYEKLSQNINRYVEPKPMDSINISYYVSNGYLVFTPDIVYQTGYPGQSALKCVMAGVNAVTARGFVDEKNIGIQGHSWGGYQIAYMVTQTSRFKAAEDGAPVANMISAYDGIRWGPGRPRQFQYEQTQSRIGGTIWDYPLRFIENSPIFMVDKVQTPLLIIHNDADDAVPWYQGIEFFLALRRLNKEAYMFTYNGEPHHLRRRPNQKDYAVRMAQFFNYELKGGPKPEWMEKGIPYLHTPEQAAAGDIEKK